MTIRARILAVVLATLATLLVALYAFGAAIWQAKFAKLELLLAEKGLSQALEGFEAEQERVAALTEDWAHWDATYAFIADGNQAYRDANLHDAGVAVLRTSFVVYLDATGAVVAQKHFDRVRGVGVPPPPAFTQAIGPDGALSAAVCGDAPIRGLARVGPDILFVACCPILTSQKSGPPRGHLVEGLYLDDRLARELSERTRTTVRFGWPDSPGLARSPDADDDVVRAGQVLEDLRGEPVVRLAVEVPRSLTHEYEATVRAFALFLIVAGLVVAVVVLGLLDRSVFARLDRVAASVAAVPADGLLVEPLTIGGNDELSAFAAALNRVVEALVEAKLDAEAATEAKSQFVATLSHEIRNPLTGVIGVAALLEREELTPRQRELVSMLTASGRMLHALVDDVLDLAKIESGKLELQEGRVDLRQVCEECLRLVSARLEEKAISTTAVTDPTLAPAYVGDPTRLRQVVLNLVGNAAKFTEAGAIAVMIDRREEGEDPATPLAPDSDWVRFTVQDTGVGIARDAQARLFAPFAQAGRVSGRHGGTGLGLTIAKSLVELMGGRIQAESAPSEGTRVWFTIPLRRESGEAPAARPKPQAPNPSFAGLLALVADDDRVSQTVARRILEQLGCRVEVADDGADAVRLASEGSFDVIFLDAHMPELDGPEAAARIRAAEEGPERTPIVALTGSVRPEDAARYREVGMDEVLAKPVRVEDVEAVLARLVKAPASPTST